MHPECCSFSSVPLGLGVERASPSLLVSQTCRLEWEEKGHDTGHQSEGNVPEANSQTTGNSPSNMEHRGTEGLLRS